MPLFSAFTPLGLHAFSSKPSLAEDIYRALVAAQSAAFDMSQGTPAEAEAYADAMALARARAVSTASKNQRDPKRTYEMLPDLERDFGVVPGETDSVATRQDAVSARKAVSRGPRAESIENGLRGILGDSFVTYRVTSNAERVLSPTNPSTGPGTFARDELPSKRFTLASTVSMTGVEVSFTYARLGGDDGLRLAAGDIVCVEPEVNVQTERVTIVSATGLSATAVFTKAHGPGATVTAGSVPIWRSTKRRVFVVVTALASIDPETRRKVNDYMARISRGVTTWSIIQSSSSTTIGPFTVGLSHLGTVPIGISTIP